MKVSKFAKSVVVLNCAVPAILLGWDAIQGQLGANPVNFAIRTTGLLSLIFLMLTLLVTPVSRITRWGWVGQFRRVFGLFAFFYALIHFSVFFGLDRNASISSTISEIGKRPYLFAGMLSVALMVPLAITSSTTMIRWLGGKRWKLLHKLVYPIAILGVIHFYMLVKADVTRPVVFAAVLGALLGYRLLAPRLTPKTKPASKFWTGKLRVDKIIVETPEVRTFRLVYEDGSGLPFMFTPGQYLNISLLIDGVKVHRSYTIASPPTRSNYCELTVKREPDGTSSKHLHDVIREGDTLDISAPAGRFTFTGHESDSVVMIAGGVGITPLMSKLRWLTETGWTGTIDLIYAAKTEHDIIFRQELEQLQSRFNNLHVHIILSRESGSNWTGDRGRLTGEYLLRVVPQIASRRVQLCGPSDMMAAIVTTLHTIGVPSSQIYQESFVRATPSASGEPSSKRAIDHPGSGSVTFQTSQKTKALSAGQTILDAAVELGVDMTYDCRVGICGQCKTRLISGSVVMEVQDALSSADEVNGLILSCQARCLDEVVVEA